MTKFRQHEQHALYSCAKWNRFFLAVCPNTYMFLFFGKTQIHVETPKYTESERVGLLTASTNICPLNRAIKSINWGECMKTKIYLQIKRPNYLDDYKGKKTPKYRYLSSFYIEKILLCSTSTVGPRPIH